MIGIGYASPYRYGPAEEIIPFRMRLDDNPGKRGAGQYGADAALNYANLPETTLERRS
jgi:hypothetical protein